MALKLASAAMLVLVLIVGGAGATAYAAQDSLPSQPLYGIKIATEDLSLDWAGEQAAKFQLALKYINRRGDEIAGLSAQEEPIEEPLMTRLQEQLRYALQQMTGMSESEMQGALLQYRHSLMKQEQKMLQAQQKGASEPGLEQARNMIQAHLRLAESGLQDPVLFRQQLRNGELFGQPEMPGPLGPPEEIPPAGQPVGPGPGGQPEEPGPAGPPEEIPPGGGQQEPGPGENPQGPGPNNPDPNGPGPNDPGTNGPGPNGPGPNEDPSGPGGPGDGNGNPDDGSPGDPGGNAEPQGPGTGGEPQGPGEATTPPGGSSTGTESGGAGGGKSGGA